MMLCFCIRFCVNTSASIHELKKSLDSIIIKSGYTYGEDDSIIDGYRLAISAAQKRLTSYVIWSIIDSVAILCSAFIVVHEIHELKPVINKLYSRKISRKETRTKAETSKQKRIAKLQSKLEELKKDE